MRDGPAHGRNSLAHLPAPDRREASPMHPTAHRPRPVVGWILPLSIIFVGGLARADGPDSPEAASFFEASVRPVLVEQCWKCHGAEKQSGGLRLDSRESILEGGDAGPAVVLGEPDRS